jgi:hypothetical protein
VHGQSARSGRASVRHRFESSASNIRRAILCAYRLRSRTNRYHAGWIQTLNPIHLVSHLTLCSVPDTTRRPGISPRGFQVVCRAMCPARQSSTPLIYLVWDSLFATPYPGTYVILTTDVLAVPGRHRRSSGPRIPSTQSSQDHLRHAFIRYQPPHLQSAQTPTRITQLGCPGSTSTMSKSHHNPSALGCSCTSTPDDVPCTMYHTPKFTLNPLKLESCTALNSRPCP